MTNNLKTEEREFLKEVLYLINSKRIQNVTRDNLKTILSTEENALWVPLE
jgi:predicted nucleotidyltransferase